MHKEEDRAALEAQYRPAAEQGDAEAQFRLGEMYFHKSGFTKEERVVKWTEAAKWFRKAADQGHAEAQFNMGRICWFGIGLPAKDQDAAKAWYLRAAKQGDVRSMMALHWYHEVAELGYAEAQYKLGEQYAEGTGVPQDETEAMAWYLKAANNTNTYSVHLIDHPSGKAAYAIAMMYAEGRGVPKDEKTALAWLFRAAEKGNPEAPWDIANRYARGMSVPQDTAVAAEWYVEAELRQDDGEISMRGLDKRCKDRGIPLDDMLAAYFKAAAGFDYLAWELAQLYKHGWGVVSPDEIESQKWLQKSGW